MSRITKQQVVDGAVDIQGKNPEGTITAVMTVTKKIVFSNKEDFEEQLLSLKGDRIVDCQFQVSLIDTKEELN